MKRIDPASLVVFRVAFGALLVILIARYFVHGWIEPQFYAPKHFFTFEGLDWVRPWPRPFMEVHFAILGLLAAFIAAGFLYRLSAALFCIGFTYVHLIDKTNYLNHYYLIALLTGLLAFLPLGRAGSIDVRLGRTRALESFPAWPLHLLRFQVGVVYFFAGLAKLQPDWLLRGQPLRLWLVQSGIPLVDEPWIAIAGSWAAALLDLAAPFLLLHRRLRVPAACALVVFHTATGLLFPIGLFPLVMLVAITLFLTPDWPRRWLPKDALARRPTDHERPTEADHVVLSPVARAAIGAYVLLQLVLPLRHHLYESDVLWAEEGFRYSWRVMLTHKVAVARFAVRDPNSGERHEIRPEDYLTPAQVHFMTTQPDMIRAFAEMVRREAQVRGRPPPEVHAEVSVSLNGHPARPMIDRSADLAAQALSSGWIRP